MASRSQKTHRTLRAYEDGGAIAAMLDNEGRGQDSGAKTRLLETAVAALLGPKHLAARFAHARSVSKAAVRPEPKANH